MSSKAYYHRTAEALRLYLKQELKIEANTHYRIRESVDGPRLIVMHMVVNPHYSKRIISMTEELSQAAGLGKEERLKIERGRKGALSVEIPKPQNLWYNVSIRSLPRRGGVKATLGLDTEHIISLADFANPLTPHMLIAGTTGSGKTNAQRLMIYDLANQNSREDAQFVLIDTVKRGRYWRSFAGSPNLAHSIITDDNKALKALMWATAEIDKRAQSERLTPRIFIAIDEVQALLSQDPFQKLIADIASVGRDFGIHLMLATQNPTAEQIGDMTIKRNLTLRLVGKVDSPEAAKAACGVGGTEAEWLVGAGDMLLVQPTETKRITTALLTDNDISQLPRIDNNENQIDLTEYEDADRVLSQANNENKRGRKQDPFDFHLIGELLGRLSENDNEIVPSTLAGKMRLHVGKLERHLTVARQVLSGLEDAGYTIMR